MSQGVFFPLAYKEPYLLKQLFVYAQVFPVQAKKQAHGMCMK